MTHTTTRDAAPIACSLSAPDFRRRVQDAEEVARRTPRARRPIAPGARLAFVLTVTGPAEAAPIVEDLLG